MKNIIPVLFLALPLCAKSQLSFNNCDNKYFDYILKNKGFTKSYFVLLDVLEPSGNKKNVIIQNHLLYDIICNEKTFDSTGYDEKIRIYIKGDSAIKLKSNLDKYKYYFYEVVTDKASDKYSKLNDSCFLKKLFDENGFYLNSSEIYVTTVVKELFRRRLLARISHNTGMLKVDFINYCK
ncbi:MAG: hypothetical protein HYR66_07265 [Sphingobacteriales bacterium]|nr:hypothetical protein [Sphingobacteriales bacterium]MBI3718177.1 hypothetical protein [Sphingobacteriales bacterium]